MVLFFQSRSQTIPILVAAHTSELQMLAIEKEPLIRIDIKIANPDIFLYAVYFFSIFFEYSYSFIQIRVFNPIPQMRIFNSYVTKNLVIVDVRISLTRNDFIIPIK